MIYFTSDQHYGGEFIRDLYNRPFKTVEIMDKELIKRHNERVGDNDTVIMVGDFWHDDEKALNTFNYYVKKLKGTPIFLKGNHEHVASVFPTFMVVGSSEGKAYVTHDPVDANTKYKINVVGHMHDKWLVRNQYNSWVVNVSVEMWNYYPVSFDDIRTAISKGVKDGTV